MLVVGCPRSGTTILARAIGSLRAVGYLEEAGLVGDVYPAVASAGHLLTQARAPEPVGLLWRSYFSGRIREWQGRPRLPEVVEAMLRHAKLPAFDLRPSSRLVERYRVELTATDRAVAAALLAKYQPFLRRQPVELLRIIMRDFQLLTGTEFYLGKTPLQVLFAHTTWRLFTHARICQIVRNYRDVAASYIQTFGRKEGRSNSARYIFEMRERALALDAALRRQGESRYCRVDYEDFLRDAATQLPAVLQFFAVPYAAEELQRILPGVRETPSTWDGLTARERAQIEALEPRAS